MAQRSPVRAKRKLDLDPGGRVEDHSLGPVEFTEFYRNPSWKRKFKPETEMKLVLELWWSVLPLGRPGV